MNEDFILIDRFLGGDVKAFDELVIRYQQKVFNVAYRILGDYHEANDVSQDAFVRVHHSLRNFRRDASFYTYLYRIVVNLCKNRIKTRGAQRERIAISLNDPVETDEGIEQREIKSHEPTPREILDGKERDKLVQEAIGSLEDGFREIVVLRDIEGLPYEEIAEILKADLGTVKSRLHRARMALKDKLKGVI